MNNHAVMKVRLEAVGELADLVKFKSAEHDVIRVRMEAALLELETAKRRRELVEHEFDLARAVHDSFSEINARHNLTGTAEKP